MSLLQATWERMVDNVCEDMKDDNDNGVGLSIEDLTGTSLGGPFAVSVLEAGCQAACLKVGSSECILHAPHTYALAYVGAIMQ
jgi:hypothetical protein